MINVEFFEHADAKALQGILRALPDGATIVGMYSRGGNHCAWVQFNAASESPEPSSKAVEASEIEGVYKKSKKWKGK